MQLGADSVFVVTGAAGSIVSAITADLAAASGGTFHLLDLTPTPDRRRPGPRGVPQRPERAQGHHRRTDEGSGRACRHRSRSSANSPASNGSTPRSPPSRPSRQRAAPRTTTRSISPMPTPSPPSIADVRETQRSDRRAAARRRARDQPQPARQGAPRVRPRLRREERRLVQPVPRRPGLPIGAAVVFSSVAGRFGNQGQTDYSAANDLLCKITSSFRRTRPDTRGLALDWTAWGGIGMATRGSIPKIMEMAGVQMLPPEAGVAWIRRELTVGHDRRRGDRRRDARHDGRGVRRRRRRRPRRAASATRRHGPDDR